MNEMDKRQEKLSQLRCYIQEVDKEVTMLLQSLQWDRKHLEGATMVTCKYDPNHKVPPNKKDIHQQGCFLKCLGYAESDKLLPDPLNPGSGTVVKLDCERITEIIDNASKSDPLFKKGSRCKGPEPLTMERLHVTYTADERKAIYDAVVNVVPSQTNAADLTLPSSVGAETSSKGKSHLEMVAELRDMKRRRAKYRVAAKTKNYSDVLRDVIKTQMELFAEVYDQTKDDKVFINTTDKLKDNSNQDNKDDDADNKHQFNKKPKDEHKREKRHKSEERHKEDRHKRKSRESKDRSMYDVESYKQKRDRERHSGNRKHESEQSSRSKSDKYHIHEMSDREVFRSKSNKESANYSSRKRQGDEKYTNREKCYEKRRDHIYDRTEELQYRRYYDNTELPYEEKRRRYK